MERDRAAVSSRLSSRLGYRTADLRGGAADRLGPRSLARGGPSRQALEELHHHVSSEIALKLTHRLTLATAQPRPRALFERTLRDALPELPWNDIAVQTSAHLRVLVPGDEVAPVPLHTDFGIGH